jgi:hypothetical protein
LAIKGTFGDKREKEEWSLVSFGDKRESNCPIDKVIEL